MDPKQQKLLATIEAILFVEGGVVSFDRLARLCEVTKEEIVHSTKLLGDAYDEAERGLSITRTDTSCALSTHPQVADAIEALQKKSLEKDIGPAGLEVLAILLYKGPASRASIDYIRGVNSASTIRNLLLRELVERVRNPEDAREFVYRPSAQTLAHLGVTDRKQIPEYEAVEEAFAAFEKSAAEHNGQKHA